MSENEQVPPANITSPTPMDEFEVPTFASGDIHQHNNAKLKKLAIALGGVIVVLVIVIIASFFIKKPTQGINVQVQSTPIESAIATPLKTAKPITSYPGEYQDIDNKITEYENAVKSPNQKRDRLKIPILNLVVTF